MKKYLLYAGSLVFASFALQSCLDFDDPGDELNLNTIQTETTKYVGNVDTIPYLNQPTEQGVQSAIDTLIQYGYLGQTLQGQWCLRGAKEGDNNGLPSPHAYQRQYSLGPDTYAQYFTIPHKDFMYGTITSTYNVSPDFNGDALGAYGLAKNYLMPLLHHPMVDSIPEIKAINLLYYCLGAQEKADLAGPFTYLEDKQNSESPSEYNDLRTIYYGIVENIDTIVACLKHYETRPDWYKEKIGELMMQYSQTSREFMGGDFKDLSSYIKLANSLKLRMAIHVVKVEPATAKMWAESAVDPANGGVVESFKDQQGIFPSFTGFIHPLKTIQDWGDLRLSASFESLLMSLDHPYTKYLILPNSIDLTNTKTGEVTPAGTRICGVRSGLLVGDGQTVATNPLAGYSTLDGNLFADGMMSPLYFLKWAEVDLLRAEGVIRGWNVGGGMSAQQLYERAIRNAFFEEPAFVEYGGTYADFVEDYLNIEEALPYVNVDPVGSGEDWPSVTKIGVKWNEGDDNETKLEKIITQKYIALFPLSTEAWAELRRTGYPKLFPVLNTDDGDGSIDQGDMNRRIPWVPTDPIMVNMVETSGIPALGGPDEQATRLWWDVDAPNF